MSTGGGNLVIATGNVGTTKDIVFATGGFLAANEKMRYSNSGNILTVSGAVTAGGNITSNATILADAITGLSGTNSLGMNNYNDLVTTLTYGATITPNIAVASIQRITLTGNVTFNAFGGTPTAGQNLVLIMTQDGTGGRTLTSTMKFAQGNKTLTTAPNAVDILSVFFDGTNYWATLSNGYV
jgi:hypothetical protein